MKSQRKYDNADFRKIQNQQFTQKFKNLAKSNIIDKLNLPEHMILEQIANDPDTILKISNPSKKAQMLAVSLKNCLIEKIYDPDYDVLLHAFSDRSCADKNKFSPFYIKPEHKQKLISKNRNYILRMKDITVAEFNQYLKYSVYVYSQYNMRFNESFRNINYFYTNCTPQLRAFFDLVLSEFLGEVKDYNSYILKQPRLYYNPYIDIIQRIEVAYEKYKANN